MVLVSFPRMLSKVSMFVVLALWCALPSSAATLSFNFGEDAEGSVPPHFLPVLHGGGVPPVWQIVSAQVPSQFQAYGTHQLLLNPGWVLAQTSQDPTDERYPILVYTNQSFKDFTFETRFEVVTGAVEQMAGLVFRYQNSSNFYVLRVSVLGKNIAFYKIVNGDLVSPVKLPLAVDANTWHQIKLDCTGTYISCYVDGQKALPTITDSGATNPEGMIGFWTKSDSVTYFGNSTVTYTPLVPAAQQIVNDIIAGRPKLVDIKIYTQNGANAPRVIASKNPSDLGKNGSDAEKLAIESGTVSLGFDHGTVIVTMPLTDRNGDNIAAVRITLKSFFGETQDNAVTRARMVQQDVEQYCSSVDNLQN